MAARANGGRSPAATRRRPVASAKRRVAARKRPAARSGPSRIKWDRVGRIALTLVLVAVAYSYLNPAIDFVKTYTQTTDARAELHRLQEENTRLHNRVQSAKDPIVVDSRARAMGLVAEGERPIRIRGLAP